MGFSRLFIFKTMSNNAMASQRLIVLYAPVTIRTVSTIKLCKITELFGVFLETNITTSRELGTYHNEWSILIISHRTCQSCSLNFVNLPSHAYWMATANSGHTAMFVLRSDRHKILSEGHKPPRTIANNISGKQDCLIANKKSTAESSFL